VLRLPNAAIHFYPPLKLVRPQDRHLLNPVSAFGEDDDEESLKKSLAPVDNLRHVWVVTGKQLTAVEVTIGISDEFYTEITSGDLQAGDAIVISAEM
jgi:hypothetical protein